MRKRLVFLLTAALAVTLLTGCGGQAEQESSGQQEETESAGSEEEAGAGEKGGEADGRKEEALSVLADDSVFAHIYGRTAFLSALEKETGIAVSVTQPPQDAYYELVEQTFEGTDWPDLLLLDAAHYAEYAARGALWDMTESYDRAAWKEKISEPEVVESWKRGGKLYGIVPFSGNGYVTYVKKAWLDQCGLEVPRNYIEYLGMCRAFTTGDPDGNGIEGDTYAVTAFRLVGDEAPYTGCLPEFYQDANPGFYLGEDGAWHDGFTERAMRSALVRLRSAYVMGYLDKNVLLNDISACYDDFVEDRCGVITYWSGSFASELRAGLEAGERSGELVVLPPIAELGAYREEQPSFWCITTACREPEKAFRFLGSMLDGGDSEFLWTYGVEGIHWSVKEEEVLDRIYGEGEFHGLRNRERQDIPCTKAYIEPSFALVPLTSSSVPDPLENAAEETVSSAKLFRENSRAADLPPYTPEMAAHYDDLERLKEDIITKVVTGELTPMEGMRQFDSGDGAAWSKAILDSLNQ